MDPRTSLALLPCALLVPIATAAAPAAPRAQEELVELRGEGVLVERSCTLVAPAAALPDAGGEGLVRIAGDGITVRVRGALVGGPHLTAPEALAGTGILVTGRDVRLVGAQVHGFQVGIRAVGADGLVLEDCDVSWNFRQRLGSTPAAEDASDWLWPHDNDGGEWAERYGAGILVERSRDVTVRRCRARGTQNGLILDRVEGSRVYDNDFSFLSGWGLAMWRSSGNVIARNALDFCVRGYSHGVYNRGQDSAGILMFEQCRDNVIAENSATHGGDGFFGFSGQEALGERPVPPDFDFVRRGNTDNLLLRNDFSYAAAHGIEMTFGFGNRLVANRLVGNAICGVWGGYSKDTLIAGNEIAENGDMAYGLERGGVNVEHGERNRIVGNRFSGNACGVHLWWDPDEGLTRLPWSRANGHGCGANEVVGNSFEGDELALQVRDCPGNVFAGNELAGVGRELDATPGSEPLRPPDADGSWELPEPELPGETRPVGARAHLRGRAAIVVGEWGPWDHETPLLQPMAVAGRVHAYQVLGQLGAGPPTAQAEGDVLARVVEGSSPPRIEVAARRAGSVAPYVLSVTAGDARLERTGVLVDAQWDVTLFPWTVDPREDAAAWRAQAAAGTSLRLDGLALPFGSRGPSELPQADGELRAAALPADRFGTLASVTLRLPAGRWELVTRSDDGLRVWADDQLVIDDWTWHAPREISAELALDEPREIRLRVEHFELDGHAVLSLEIRPLRD